MDGYELMKKYTLILLLLIFCCTFAGAPHLKVLARKSVPCSSPTSTYLFVWTGEHAASDDTACINNGAGTITADVEDAGVITNTSAISGAFEITLDANNEAVEYKTGLPASVVDCSIFAAGTLTFMAKIGGTLPGTYSCLFEIRDGAIGDIDGMSFYTDTGKIACKDEMNDANKYWGTAGPLTINTTHMVQMSWRVNAGNDAAVRICTDGLCDTEEWVYTDTDRGAASGGCAVDQITLGDDNAYHESSANGNTFDNFILKSGWIQNP